MIALGSVRLAEVKTAGGCNDSNCVGLLRERVEGSMYHVHFEEQRRTSPWLQGGMSNGSRDVEKYLTSNTYDPEINKYGVACGQTIEEWEAAGWIVHEYDVRGWFQWYCRFWLGRRCADDDRQISRWKRCVTDRGHVCIHAHVPYASPCCLARYTPSSKCRIFLH